MVIAEKRKACLKSYGRLKQTKNHLLKAKITVSLPAI